MGQADILRRIEWYGWAFTAVPTLVAFVSGYLMVAAGLGVGGSLSVLHFKWLAFFLTAVVMPDKRPYSRMKKIVLGAYAAKYLILGGTVYLLFRYGLVDPVAFLGGLSVIFLAICVGGIRHSMHVLERQG
jgi:hypothetical protein